MRILVIFDSGANYPADYDYSEEFSQEDWFTEAAVIETLTLMGHNVEFMGLHDDVAPLYKGLSENRPDVVFNLTEVFAGKASLDKNIPAFLELMRVPYTGCNADGLIVCNNKALSKKIFSYHKIKTPQFHTFRKNYKIRVPLKLQFPLIVKPLREEASTGISMASHVKDETELCDRIRFIHSSMNMNAIAEEYIEGQELYISILGNKRLQSFPVREMEFRNMPAGMPRFATFKAKWDENYRKKWGIVNGFATGLAAEMSEKMVNVCKKAYRSLNLDGYARFDCRLTDAGKLYIVEANGNPELAQGDEFAEAAQKAGMSYDILLDRILRLAFARE